MLSRCCNISRSSLSSFNPIYFLKINEIDFNPKQCRNYHLSTLNPSHPNVNGFKQLNVKLRQSKNVFISQRYASTDHAITLATNTVVGHSNNDSISNAANNSNNFSYETLPIIPDVPPIPAAPIGSTTTVADIIEVLPPGVEPSFASIGLGGWTPVGIIQNCLEYVHITLDVPWWGAIAIGTLVVRMILLPLVILSQRNAAKMNNNLPQMQLLQLKMTEARQSGNSFDSARYGQEMVLFMREKNVNPLKNMLVPLAQAPVFISFFMGLRKMANTPVESMREGGLFWFTDLTLADPYFILPAITSATLYLTIELGTDSAKLSSQNMQTMRYVLRALPIFIFPFTMNFPAGILCYWVSSNFISLAQVGILRIPSVRDYFKIERTIIHTPDALPVKPKPFVKGIKDSWQNLKITNELAERQRIHEMSFKRAGKGPLIKTYKYDPTKNVSETTSSTSTSTVPTPIHAKKR